MKQPPTAWSRIRQWLTGRAPNTGAESMQAALEAAAEKAREAERQRIAGDFHDGPLQIFISFQMRLEILRRLLNRDTSAGLRELDQLQDLAKSQVSGLRAFIRSMRPLDFGDSSLTASIRRLVDDFQKDSGVPVTFIAGEIPLSAEQETYTHLLQIIREALHNVLKHAKATRVAVALEQHGNMLEISIDDNGVGFPFSGVYSLEELDLLRMGPTSIRRRARSIGAEVQLESRPGRGSGLRLRVPV